VFAAGALSAAKFIAGKTAGLYTMNDLLKNT
jgi:dihydrodipicolinate reductase